jgi:hypothetical protein
VNSGTFGFSIEKATVSSTRRGGGGNSDHGLTGLGGPRGMSAQYWHHVRGTPTREYVGKIHPNSSASPLPLFFSESVETGSEASMRRIYEV